MTAIQCVEDAHNESDANMMLDGLAAQQGYIGGRLLPPAPSKPTWRVQAFFKDETDGQSWLPDGLRRVVIPPSQAKSLGIMVELS